MRWRPALLSLLLSASAAANGRYPTANQLVVRPGNKAEMALRATFGVLVTRDEGKRWEWICEEAIGYSGELDPGVAYAASGAVFVAINAAIATSAEKSQLALSRDSCAWTHAGPPVPPGVSVADVTVRPPSGVLAVSSEINVESALYSSDDDGLTFKKAFTFDQSLVLYTVESAGKRVYVTAARKAGQADASALLLVSDDDGASFTERAIPVDNAKEKSTYIAGVDPTSADRVYVRSLSDQAQAYGRLYVSEDAGKTFRAIFTGGPLRGFALSGDGAKLWVGGAKDKLMAARRADFAFTRVSDLDVQCLTWADGALFACSNDPAFALGRSLDDGATFAPVLKLEDVRPLACAACGDQWPKTRDLLKVPLEDAGAPVAQKPKAGCSCEASPGPPLFPIIVVLWVFMRRALLRGRAMLR